MILADEQARLRIRNDLDTSFVVEAAAGTGKTSELVKRIINMLKNGRAQLREIVAVTFTEKAAGEMKLRLRREIEEARGAAETDAERAYLLSALEQLEETRVGTIHSLCSDLLHEHPVGARVDPLFSVMSQDEAERLFDEAFNNWFHRVIDDPPEGVRRVLRRRRRGSSSPGPYDILRSTGWRLSDQRDFDGPWVRRSDFNRNDAIDALLLELGAVGALVETARKADDKLLINLRDIQRFVVENQRKEAIRQARDYDGLEAELRALSNAWSWKRRGWGKMFSDEMARVDVLTMRDVAKEKLDDFLEEANADVAACLHADLRPLISEYEALKERSGKLDFLDLLIRARNLIRDRPKIRAELQTRFSHVFVDEFQDTDPLQAEILILLSADDPNESDWRRVRPRPGKLFIVGDPKQSIYRFRRADIALYQAIKERLGERGVASLHLTTSFRGVPNIQRTVNAAFAPIMQGQRTAEGATQAEYVGLDAFRPDVETQPSVVVLPVPRPYNDWGQVRKFVVDDSLPDAVAGLIHWLINDSDWTVTERENPTEPVSLRARHICLLFRRFRSFDKDVTRGYRRALEARRIPHVLVGGRSFHEREEILAIRNALTAVEWPDDEFSVFATLRGPFFALGDDMLLAYRDQYGRLNPLFVPPDAPSDAGQNEVAEALQVLGRLHRRRNRHPVADTISRLLEATRAHASLAIWPSGEQALANAMRLMDVARRFEASGATSFRSFVERLLADADRGQATEAPVIEEGTDGVRVMTVHQAKGLEFPVVILCDPTANKTRRHPSRFVDTDKRIWAEPIAGGCAPPILLDNKESALIADEHEAERLAYVAATRARDLLVIPAVGDEKMDGWLDVLNEAAYPDEAVKRNYTEAAGAPPFGDDSVLTRPMKAERGPYDSVRPGQHTIGESSTHNVVWWDPRVLDLDLELDGGLRQDKLLQADKDNVVADQGVRAHAEWKQARDTALAKGAKPSVRASSITQLSVDGHPAGDAPVRFEQTDVVRDGRPAGKRFGTLVHAVLSVAALDATAEDVSALSRIHGRMIGAPASEVEATIDAVVAALAHPIMEAARTADATRRETPVIVEQPDGLLAEGIVDLAYKTGDTWMVVDFKTDTDPHERQPLYETQVRLYMQAISRATGDAAEGALFWV